MAVIGRQVEADLAGTGLEVWEDRFCQWLAMQPKNGLNLTRQAEVATYLAGTTVSPHELKALRLRPAWRARWADLRDVDRELRAAKAEFADLVRSAPAKYKKMLDKAVADDDVRAATPLLTPLLDRAMPKQTEENVMPRELHIHLSAGQARGLDAPAHVVEAEEVVIEESSD